MGPTGRNVIIDKSFGGPTVTKDGVTVAKEDRIGGPLREYGLEAGRRSGSVRRPIVAGDGTTTATVLARAIFK